jgi:uncharacterized protein YjbI with pentapeptide repeats
VADPTQVAKINEGVSAWNAWRAQSNTAVDFSGADMAGKDLTGADLRSANFDHANMRGVTMGFGTLVWNANFNYAEMYEANLEGAELQDASFNGADIFKASFRDANLRCSDLSNPRGGLLQDQLAGADITNARLPELLSKLLAGLDNVKNISESARKLFLVVLAACLYTWLTIATTTDLNLITDRASSPLPIIQTSVRIVGFYIVSPLLLLCVYLYFHFYLQKLWEELASLPAVLQDGRPLHAKVDPWLMNDLVRSHVIRLNAGRPFMSYLQLWISVLVAWWMVPITMFLFWGRYLRRQEWHGTIFHAAMVTVASVAAWSLYRLAVESLRGKKRRPFTWKRILTGWRGYQAIIIGALVFASLVFASFGTIQGERPGLFGIFIRSPHGPLHFHPIPARTWMPSLMQSLDYHPFASLNNAQISEKGTDWSCRPGEEPHSVIGAQLAGVKLRNAEMMRSFLVDADLSRADLTDAYLLHSDFCGSQLTGATLSGALLNHADFSNAFLMGAKFDGADLDGVVFDQANVDVADFRGAKHLQVSALKRAKNWQTARYDKEMLKLLEPGGDQNKKTEPGTLPGSSPPPPPPSETSHP